MEPILAHRRGHVLHAEVAFGSGADPRAPGGAVTVALCGSWEHDGSCRWPHHTAVDSEATPSQVRVVFDAWWLACAVTAWIVIPRIFSAANRRPLNPRIPDH